MSLRHGKSVVCKVILLDDLVPEFNVSKKAIGEDLFAQVVKHLQLLEADYFGLEFQNKEQAYVWLDREKPLMYQVGRDHDLSFKFKVKFYSPDPNLLEDEFTRYLFALQIKQDLSTGRLVCNTNTTAILSAYIAQGELGDYSEEEMPDHTYLKCISFVPNQTDELEQCIMQYHRGLGGMTPSDADFSLLDTARKTDYYGIVLHSAHDHESVDLQLAVTEAGIYVYQNKKKINTFSWAKIRKLSFKRKRFLIKLHPSADQAYYKNIVEFFFSSRNQSKHFWKTAIEHYTFFRCRAVDPPRKHRRAVLTRGSSFRYTGRTQKQLIDHVKENYIKGSRSFERTLSARHTLHTGGTRSFTTSRSTTLNSKREFHAQELSISSGSHVIGGSESQHSGLRVPPSPGPTTSIQNRASESASATAPEPTHATAPVISPPPPVYTALHGIDRKHSEPVLGRGQELGLNNQPLIRMPDFENIPEKVQEPSDQLTRSESVKDIPQEIDQDQHAEPKTFLHAPVSETYDTASSGAAISPAMVRVHSEADTTASGKHPRDVELAPAPPPEEAVPTTNHTQFSIGNSSEVLNGGRASHAEAQPDHKKKRLPADKSYFIAKELLMTERTYHKDLSIVIESFREHMSVDGAADITLSRLYEYLQPLYDNHCELLDQLEKRMGQQDSRISSDSHSASANVEVTNLISQHLQNLECYRAYLCSVEEVLTDLVRCCDSSDEFSKRLQEFERQKLCYLPVFALILKPAHRLVYYEIALSRLVAHYSLIHCDYTESKSALASVTEILGALRSVIAELENTEKLVELQEDVGGITELVHPGRYFIREGCLQKLSRRGYQQRLFLLMSDILLYTSRSPNTSQSQFKVHGFMPLKAMSLEESEPNTGATYGFTIYGANRCIIVSANSQEEKDKWLEDLNFAISIANSDQIELAELPPPKITPPANGINEADDGDAPPSPDKVAQAQHRANTTMHVCWHRNTSVSIKDIQTAIKHQLSGYLLRKFKNSNGWQKLWVVFTNFCLFFYKTYQDEFPLASLPLLGYSVNTPAASDGINKDYVFKLQFKNHIYFFRAESEFTFDRWMEVISSATHSSRRTRMFSRMDSTT